MKNRIINSTIINFVNVAVSLVISMIMTPVILHRLGNEQYGLWVFLGIFSISGYFSLLDLGMQGTAIKYIAEYHAKGDANKLNKIINSVVFFFLIVGILACFVLLFINNYFLGIMFRVPVAYYQLVKLLINILAVNYLIQFPALGLAAIVEGLQRYDWLRCFSITTAVISNLIIYFYLNAAGGLIMLTIIAVISSITMVGFYYIISRLLLPGLVLNPLSINIKEYSSLFNMSGKLFLSRIVGLIFNYTDKIIIAVFLTMTAMTQYDIVNKVHFILILIMGIMNSTLVPFSSRLDALNDEGRMRQLFLKGTKYAVIVSMPALVFFMVMSSEFIGAWVGREYSGLSLLTRFYLSHCFVTLLTGVASTMMVGMNKLKVILRVSVSMALVNLVISLATVRCLGITGLIAGTVIAYIIGQLILINMFSKIFKTGLKCFFDEVVIKAYSLGAFLALLAWLLKHVFNLHDLLPLFIFALMLYVVYISIYLLIDREERKVLLEQILRLSVGWRKRNWLGPEAGQA